MGAVLCMVWLGCKQDAPQVPQTPQAPAAPAAPAEAAKPEVGEEQDSGLPAGTNEQIILLTRAKRYVLQGDHDSAEPLFEALVKQERFTEPVLTGTLSLVALRIEQGKRDEALALCDALLAREDAKAHAEPFLLAGRVYAAQGEPQRAKEALMAAAERQPSWFFIWAELAQLAEAAGDDAGVDEALARYEAAHTLAVGRLTKKIAGPSERIKIIDALALVDDEASRDPLIAALKDEDPLVRERAAHALGEFGAGEFGGEPVREALKGVLVYDTHEPVREAARAALKRLKQGGK
jgi:tetratricopeptide (TPR) repeat protein